MTHIYHTHRYRHDTHRYTHCTHTQPTCRYITSYYADTSPHVYHSHVHAQPTQTRTSHTSHHTDTHIPHAVSDPGPCIAPPLERDLLFRWPNLLSDNHVVGGVGRKGVLRGACAHRKLGTSSEKAETLLLVLRSLREEIITHEEEEAAGRGGEGAGQPHARSTPCGMWHPHLPCPHGQADWLHPFLGR